MKNLLLVKVMFFMILATMTSCNKSNIEGQPTTGEGNVEKRNFEKQLVIFDQSGNNSITLNISSDDPSLLTNYSVERYELILNPSIPAETIVDKQAPDYEESDFLNIESYTLPKRIPVQLVIENTNFSDKVNNYALVSHGTLDIIEEDTEEENLKAGLCFWHPRDYQYYDEDAYGATKVKMEFNRTKLTCNNIKYYVCKYQNYNDGLAYAYHHLKHPSDEATTFTQSGQPGISLLYKHYKNQIPTYTFYY